jgi:hypothetical protein
MITNDKFNNDLDSFKSRLISNVFSSILLTNRDNLCLTYVYNINSQSNDGFNIYFENYLNSNDIKLLTTKRGPLSIDKWYLNSIQVNISNYNQFRVSIKKYKIISVYY